MDLQRELQRVDELNGQDKSKQALKLLDKIERAFPGNLEVTWQRVQTLLSLGRQAEARQLAETLVETRGDQPFFWQTCAFLRLDDYAAALSDIERGLARLPGNTDLLRSKAVNLQQLGRPEEGYAIHDALVVARRGDLESLCDRAAFADACANDVAPGEVAATDPWGASYGIAHVERALADYTAALALQDSPKLRSRRARCLRRLHREAEAQADFEAALAGTDEASPARQFLAEELKGPQAQLMEVLGKTRATLHAADKDMTLSDQIADSLVRSIEDQIAAGATLPEAMDAFASEDPDDIRAVSVARQMFNLGQLPVPDLQPVDPKDFPAYMRRYCDQATRELEAAGFRVLGSYEAVHLTPLIGQSVLLRCLVSADGAACATAYAIQPLWPGWQDRVVLALKGKWDRLSVLDCETEFEDGSFLATNNTGERFSFAYGASVRQNVLPARTPVAAVVDAHRQALTESLRPRRAGNFEELLAMQTRMQEAKAAYRRSIAYATDEELRRHLGEFYEQLAAKVRAKLETMARAASSVSKRG